jgi:hypothetical protein
MYRNELAPMGGHADGRWLCVAIHDVAPQTWDACLVLEQVVREVADLPLTWLVVPRYHAGLDGESGWTPDHMRALDRRTLRGDELVLHGYTHSDEAPLTGPLRERLLRAGYTRREGEFSALGREEAQLRIRLGLEWMASQGWQSAGFVPPAWLMGADAWAALQEFRLAYVTTYRYLHDLNSGHSWHSPALVYSARNAAGRILSEPFTQLLARRLAHEPLVRVALHPADARHPALLRHTQRLLRHLLRERRATTKRGALDALAAAASGAGPRPLAAHVQRPANLDAR